jgi:hypothetical protein
MKKGRGLERRERTVDPFGDEMGTKTFPSLFKKDQ